jgi:hypothetical protein
MEGLSDIIAVVCGLQKNHHEDNTLSQVANVYYTRETIMTFRRPNMERDYYVNRVDRGKTTSNSVWTY